jgi:hypothetical protein
MTLGETLLQKLARWQPEGGRQTLEVAHPESGWAAYLDAGHVETLGCRLWELALRRLSTAPPADLKDRAERVAARAAGLLEPLRVVEVDDGQGMAQLRSDRPGQWGDGHFYYEALLQADGGLTLHRYQAPGTDQPRRQQVPFTLTHEAIGRLADQLTEP